MTKFLEWKTLSWQWLLACVAARLLQILLDGVAGWLVSTTEIGGSNDANSSFLLALILFRLLSGALGGVSQWLVLRSWWPVTRGWVLATSLGSAIAFSLSNGLWSATLTPPPETLPGYFLSPQSVVPGFVWAGLSGLVLGISQWLVLRTKLPQAYWWIPLSGIGMLAEAALVVGLQSSLGSTGIDVSTNAFNPVYWAIAAIGVVIYAAMTGGFLIRCLRQRSGSI